MLFADLLVAKLLQCQHLARCRRCWRPCGGRCCSRLGCRGWLPGGRCCCCWLWWFSAGHSFGSGCWSCAGGSNCRLSTVSLRVEGWHSATASALGLCAADAFADHLFPSSLQLDCVDGAHLGATAKRAHLYRESEHCTTFFYCCPCILAFCMEACGRDRIHRCVVQPENVSGPQADAVADIVTASLPFASVCAQLRLRGLITGTADVVPTPQRLDLCRQQTWVVGLL
mmetsp:Transcript_144208/g.401836  ORF Transcript_144208/g.401836 Transcript_144208/m.401836 type:complete len:227 (-) Transcript_144208:757-1437(-)